MQVNEFFADASKHYRLQFANSAQKETVVDLFEEISDWWGFGINSLAYRLHGHTEPVRVRVNSVGGDLIQGIAIRNFLSTYPGEVTVEVLGLCASSATVIATGANRVEIGRGAFYMIHNPMLTAWMQTADELEGNAETLRKMEGEMVQMYVDGIKRRGKMDGKTDKEMADQVREWMDAETWFTAEEAVTNGFADAVVGVDEDVTAQISAKKDFDFSKYTNTPTRVLNLVSHMKEEKTTHEKGFLAKLKQLLNAEETDAPETPETPADESTPEVDPIEAAKTLLSENGYTVEKPTAKADANDAPAPAKTYTEDEVAALVAEAVKAKAKAGAAATKTADAPPPPKETARDKILAKFNNGLKGISDMVKP